MATVSKRGNAYKITVSCGYDMNGRQIRKHMTWEPEPSMTARQIKKELDRKTVLFEEKCRTGQVLDENIKFAEFAEKWFEDYAEKQLRASTVAGYHKLMKHILPAIGHIRLSRLQPHHLMELYDNLSETGIREKITFKLKIDVKPILKEKDMNGVMLDKLCGFSKGRAARICRGCAVTKQNAEKFASFLELPMSSLFECTQEDKPLSGNSVQHYHRLISTILSTAVKWQVIFSNPCERVDPPKKQRHEAMYLDEDQAARMLQLLEDEPEQYRVMINLLIHTGLRRGELFGLEWRDINWDTGLLDVQRSSQYIAKKGVYTDDTKNKSSRRILKLNNTVLAMLKQYRTHQQQERLKLGDQWQDTDRLFTRRNGLPLDPNVLTKWFKDFVRKHDLPPICVHSLRHTNATLLIAAGINVKTVSAHLGHATIATTGNIYTHAIKSAEAAASEALESTLLKAAKKRA